MGKIFLNRDPVRKYSLAYILPYHINYFSFSDSLSLSLTRTYCSPRRKLHISIEALFMIDFPTLKHKFSFFLDRREQRVTLDISASGVTESLQFVIPNINETSTIRSMALHFHKNRIALLVDCKESDAHELDVNLAKLYIQMDDPVIKLVSQIQMADKMWRIERKA